MEESVEKKGIHPAIKVGFCLLVFYLVIKFGIKPPLPSSLIFMYMCLATVGGVVFLALFHDMQKEVFSPIFAFLGGGIEGIPAKVGRYIVLAAIPLFVWCNIYQRLGKGVEAPLEQRVIHPAPPGEAMGLYNPFGKEDVEPAEKAQYVEEGREVYFKNCVFCHGDMLDGNGLFASGINPPPANFQDEFLFSQLILPKSSISDEKN